MSSERSPETSRRVKPPRSRVWETGGPLSQPVRRDRGGERGQHGERAPHGRSSGSSATTVVPLARRGGDLEAPVERRDAVVEAAQAGAAARVGAAGAVVAHRHAQAAAVLEQLDRAPVASSPAYLATLVSASAVMK